MLKNRSLWIVLVLLVASLACNALTGRQTTPPPPAEAQAPEAGAAPTQAVVLPTEPAATQPTADNSAQIKTEFPLPGEVSNLMELGDGAINFQTKLSLQETLAFYREAFAKEGYTEREINTAITDATFSLVFDGHASGKAIVLQGVDLGGGTNVNLRFEDL
jgi:hypothetical protein